MCIRDRIRELLDVVNIKICMASATELIVNLEDPGMDVEVVRNKLG